jgi:hypothetical protein
MDNNNYSNLRLERSDVDAWRPRRSRTVDQHAAMSLVAMAGVSLLLCGVTRPPAASRWWIAGGAGLLGCAAAGLGIGQWFAARRLREEAADVVTLESMGSFPASDPPSSNASTARSQPLPQE